MRAREGLPRLREQVISREVMKRIGEANASKKLKDAFRIVHFSVQDDHVHLIIEATDGVALTRGAQGLAIRLARRVNALLGIRGQFWGDRFHSHELASPREVRNAMVYVLMNAKKHGYELAGIDTLSSAPWFTTGFTSALVPCATAPPVREAETWLGAVGWRRHGLLREDERPRVPR